MTGVVDEDDDDFGADKCTVKIQGNRLITCWGVKGASEG